MLFNSNKKPEGIKSKSTFSKVLMSNLNLLNQHNFFASLLMLEMATCNNFN